MQPFFYALIFVGVFELIVRRELLQDKLFYMKGFLGTDAPFMMDFVVVALAVLVPLLFYSIYQVKFHGNAQRHKFMQLFLAVVLLLAVVMFEIEMRLAGGIYELTGNSLYHGTFYFDVVLYSHLVFAVTTPIIWGWTIVGAMRNFRDGRMGSYGDMHRRLGWLSAVDLILTSISGIYLYYIGFLVVKV